MDHIPMNDDRDDGINFFQGAFNALAMVAAAFFGGMGLYALGAFIYSIVVG